MAELKSTEVKNITIDENNRLAVKICTLRAAANIPLPSSNDALREILLKILNNPNDTDWLDAIIYYVVIMNTEISWTTLQTDTLAVEATITTACTDAISILAGV